MREQYINETDILKQIHERGLFRTNPILRNEELPGQQPFQI